MNYYIFYEDTIPEGYITGISREPKALERLVAHLYKGSFNNPEEPVCRRGYNRGNDSYSIWRNCIGVKGICKICMKMVNKRNGEIRYSNDK